jgi:Domain of unknown function (DUF4429)
MSLVLHGGHGKSLFLTRDSIRIVEEHQGERRDIGIPIRRISSVEVKKPGAFDGYIRFVVPGGRTYDHAFTLTGGAFNAAHDDHSVTFSALDDYDIALKIKLQVETWVPATSSSRPEAP